MAANSHNHNHKSNGADKEVKKESSTPLVKKEHSSSKEVKKEPKEHRSEKNGTNGSSKDKVKVMAVKLKHR